MNWDLIIGLTIILVIFVIVYVPYTLLKRESKKEMEKIKQYLQERAKEEKA